MHAAGDRRAATAPPLPVGAQPLWARAGAAVLAASVAAALLLPPSVLQSVGVAYVLEGGNLLHKVHPATYLAAASVGLLYLARPGRLLDVLAGPGGLWPAFLALAGVLAQLALVLHQPLAGAPVTWGTALLWSAALLSLDLRERMQVFRVLEACLVVNAGAALYEFLSGHRLVPFLLVDATRPDLMIDTSEWTDWRSTAFLGHPLTGAIVMATAATAYLAQVLERGLTLHRFVLLALTAASLPAFGGRAALAVAGLLALIAAVWRIIQFLAGRKVAWSGLVAGLAAPVLILATGVALAGAGYFQPLLDRVADDNGSASTRLAALDILAATPFSDLLVGDVGGAALQRQIDLGTLYGIEISWVALLVNHGLIGLPLFLMMAWTLSRVWVVRSRGLALWPLAAFFLIDATGMGLATKTLTLSCAVLVAAALVQEPGVGARGAASPYAGVPPVRR